MDPDGTKQHVHYAGHVIVGHLSALYPTCHLGQTDAIKAFPVVRGADCKERATVKGRAEMCKSIRCMQVGVLGSRAQGREVEAHSTGFGFVAKVLCLGRSEVFTKGIFYLCITLDVA